VDLTSLDADRAVQLGFDLQRVVRDTRDSDAAPTAFVSHLYNLLKDPSTGERQCVLVRLYTTSPFSALSPEQAAFARKALPEEPGVDFTCLTLRATAGAETDWNDVTKSRGHRVIPLPSEQAIKQLPMVSQLFRELGLDLGQVVHLDRRLMLDVSTSSYNVFYVPEAAGSPHVPAQEEFVAPFGVRSVIGFGGILPSRQLFAVIMFTRAFVPKRSASMFRVVALSLKQSLDSVL
jgi:hypothetical protein